MLIAALVGLGAPGRSEPQTGSAAAEPPCALEHNLPKTFRSGPSPANYSPCAPYASVPSTILGTLPQTAFGAGNNPASVLALNEPWAVVGTDNDALFRVNQNHKVANIWPPEGRRNDYGLNVLGRFRDGLLVSYSSGGTWLIGVRTDGSLAFRKRVELAQTAPNGNPPTSAIEDSAGVIWVDSEHNSRADVYAYFPKTDRLEAVPGNFSHLFGDVRGNVYAWGSGGLYTLASAPQIHARFFHGPLPLPSPLPNQFGQDWPGVAGAIRAVGPDGSLWASTDTQVIHMHADGTIRVMRLRRPRTWNATIASNMDLRMAPDGSVWRQSFQEFVRISSDDRVETISVPWRHGDDDYTASFSIAPDSSVWYVQNLYPRRTSNSVVHFKVPDRT